MSADGEAPDEQPSETLLESLLSTLDAEAVDEPWMPHSDGDRRNVATPLRGLRALAAAKRNDATGEPQSAHASEPVVSDTDCPVGAAIEQARPFDRLAHLGPALDRRLGTLRRARAVVDGETRRVDVRVHARPDSVTDDDRFDSALAAQLDRWERVGDIDGVVPVVASGADQQPWVATASVASTVRDRNDPLERSLWHACRLTAALARLHDNSVVHAGIDPNNVVYPITVETEPPAPAFHNVGLLDVYRRHTDPARVLDPRYAAPEYFDSSHGIVDRTTDVYQLGTLLVTLLTGDAPVEGSPETVRERVLDGDLELVAARDRRLPDELDDILRQATATDPFDRYDTAAEFHRDLTALCERLLA